MHMRDFAHRIVYSVTFLDTSLTHSQDAPIDFWLTVPRKNVSFLDRTTLWIINVRKLAAIWNKVIMINSTS